MKRNLGLLILMSLLLPGLGMAGDLTFNYQGRIMSNGVPFNGTGYFKFAIYVKDSSTDRMLWYNDGFTTQTEPVNAVPVPVVNGIFNVVIGDTSLPNMAALDAVIFNVDGPIFLRTWFSDGTDGYEVLSPDSRITNPELMGHRQRGALDLYVDAATGNDNWSGLRPGHAKKTIQAAFQALPEVITNPATIHVAPGVYRETISVFNLTLAGMNAQVTLLGDPGNPTQVRISGSDATSDTAAVRDYGMYLKNVSGLFVKGITFEHHALCSFYATGSTAELDNCEFRYSDLAVDFLYASVGTIQSCHAHDCKSGFYAYYNSHMAVYDSVIEDMTTLYGVRLVMGSDGYLGHTTIRRVHENGVVLTSESNVEIAYSLIDQCGDYSWNNDFYNVELSGNCFCRFDVSTVSNNTGPGGIRALRNSYVQFCYLYGKTTVSGNKIALDAEFGSGMDNEKHNALILTGNTQNTNALYGGAFYQIP